MKCLQNCVKCTPSALFQLNLATSDRNNNESLEILSINIQCSKRQSRLFIDKIALGI